jgi:N-acyl-D-amino-acid deacylase
MTAVTLRGGSVADGSGREPVRMDVSFDQNGVIAMGVDIPVIGDLVDVNERMVLPGFIDTHLHAMPLLGEARELVEAALLSQGVTSVILGSDGIGPCPGGTPALSYANDYFGGIDGPSPRSFDDVRTVQELLCAVDGASRINVGYLVPAGTVRQVVMPNDPAPADASAVDSMMDLVTQGLEQGALGLASGLEYVPGAWASTAELVAMCRPVGEAGAVHASHMRGYENAAGDAIDELTIIGSRTGARSHVAHLRAPARVAAAALDRADELGEVVTFDSYPYSVGATLLAMRAIPRGLQVPDPDRMIELLLDRDIAMDLRRHWADRIEELGAYVVAHSGMSILGDLDGLTLRAVADRMSVPFEVAVGELLVASRLTVSCLVPPGSGASGEADFLQLMDDRRHMGCSDGIFLGGAPHPRGWGAFARMLSLQLGRPGGWSWGDAAWHLSGHAAQRFGIALRGRLCRGAVADVVVLDPSVLRDNASYPEPRRHASGVDRVYVAGIEVFRHGALVGAAAGRALRRAGA